MPNLGVPREGIDFYYEKGLVVLTKKYLLKRGFCCDTGCRHCPYVKDTDDKNKIRTPPNRGS